MNGRSYGQFCGVARALEMVGERWGLLIVRDLVLSPKRYTELQEGMPKIPASILSSRLNELETVGVVRRRVLPNLYAAVVYELTEYGSELEAVILRLGLWGARSLGDPQVGEVFTMNSAILSLYTTFRAEYAEGIRVSFELHYGPHLLHAIVDDGVLKASEGGYPDADLVIRANGSTRPLLAGEITAAEAISQGLVELTGDPALLGLFAKLFHIPSRPAKVEGLVVH